MNLYSVSPPQEHGHSHSHFHGSECYLSANGDAEGVREKLQANGEALGDKADAGEGELMLSPAQTPQVGSTRPGSTVGDLLV